MASDRSTMEERKDFFRELGLPRHEVYGYAMRSFQVPNFDLDYFEYRRHNLRNRNLSPFEINKQLLIEVFDALNATPSNGRQSDFNQSMNFSNLSSHPFGFSVFDGPSSSNNMASASFGSSFYDRPRSLFSNFDYGVNNNRNDHRNWLEGNSNRGQRQQASMSNRNWQNQSKNLPQLSSQRANYQRGNSNNNQYVPNAEAQAIQTVAQALQLFAGQMNPQQIENKQFNDPRERKLAESPFEAQRLKTFLHQFADFDGYALLTRYIPKKEYEDVDVAVKKMLANQTLKKPTQSPAAKRQKTDKDADNDDVVADESDDDAVVQPNRKARRAMRRIDAVKKFQDSDRPAEEFIKAEIYADRFDLMHQPKMSKPEFILWFKEVRWIKQHLTITDKDPAIRNKFFCRQDVPNEVNNKKLEMALDDIENVLKVTDENEQYKQSYMFLRARAIYCEFLYVFKKLYLSHEGLRALQKIFDLLFKVDDMIYCKGIIKMWIEAHENAKNDPKAKTLLADKTFNWLVATALQEVKKLHRSVNFRLRLTSLWRFVSYTYGRDVAKAKSLYQRYWYAEKDINSLQLLLKQQPEINWDNVKSFMNYELRVVNNDYNRLISPEAVEKRNIVLEELKSNSYVKKVHIYVANKMLAIYDRLAYLECVHPRMIARQDLKQLIYFRKFLATTNLKMYAKYVIEQWRKIYPDFANPKYRELFRINLIKNASRDKEENDEDNDEGDNASIDENEENANDDEKMIDGSEVEMKPNEDVEVDGEQNNIKQEAVDLVSDDNDDNDK